MFEETGGEHFSAIFFSKNSVRNIYAAMLDQGSLCRCRCRLSYHAESVDCSIVLGDKCLDDLGETFKCNKMERRPTGLSKSTFF